jgi:hypothetical protein
MKKAKKFHRFTRLIASPRLKEKKLITKQFAWKKQKKWLVQIFQFASVYAPQSLRRVVISFFAAGKADSTTHFAFHFSGTVINQLHYLF